jgi:hypothetical protein
VPVEVYHYEGLGEVMGMLVVVEVLVDRGAL